jgi:hypothetical protein
LAAAEAEDQPAEVEDHPAEAEAAPAVEAMQEAWEPDLEPATPEALPPEPPSVTTEDAGEEMEQSSGGAVEPRYYAAPPPMRPDPYGVYRPTPDPDTRQESSRSEAPRSAVAPTVPPTRREEEPLMWLGDEFERAELEVAATGWRGQTVTSARAEAPPVLALSDTELTQLARDEGWDMAEVDAIRSFLVGPATDASDVDQSPAAAQADADPDRAAESTPDPEPEPPGAEPPRASAGFDRSTALGLQPHRPPQDPTTWRPAPPEPQWLRGRRGPAATAFRRLRRLFPD